VQKVENEPLAEVVAMVGRSRKLYFFWSRNSDETLVRRRRGTDRMETLVDGYWMRCRAPRRLGHNSTWSEMRPETLVDHARLYFVENFDKSALRRTDPHRTKLRCSWIGRWLMPSPRGGEGLGQANKKAAARSREISLVELQEVPDKDIPQLKEEAETGHARELERNTKAEQRASFFLGAAGLTSSLILANAGLLLGKEHLESPWLIPAAIILAIASVCAVLSGFRAMQVSAWQWQMFFPTSADEVMGRGSYEGDDRIRAYVAGLLIACSRESAIAEWKFARVAGARHWFLGLIGGVVALTAIVLVAAV
jgi:hypothetical protein